MDKRLSSVRHWVLRLGGFLACLFVLVACASSPKSDTMKITYVADYDLNPDMNGRASPMAITFYRLVDSEAFNGMDYVTLMERDIEILGENLLSKERVIVRPGETLVRTYALNGEERAYGIVAGYRVIDSRGWKLTNAIPSARSGLMKALKRHQSRHEKVVYVGRRSMHIAPRSSLKQ